MIKIKDQKVKKLAARLEKIRAAFEIIKHPPIKTVEEGLKQLGISAADGVSTLILKADNHFVAIFRRDDHQLDLDKIKKLLKAKSLRMADAKEIQQQTGAFKGATPLLSGLPTIMDKTILIRKYVHGGTGNFEYSLRIKPVDLRKATKARPVDIIKMRRVFSGSRPTGRLHLGNYLGGLKGYLALQERGDLDCIYCIVDLHAITSPYQPAHLPKNIFEVALDYLACGLDPKKCHLMVQSQVPEHVGLAYLLGTIYPVSRIEQLPTYKDKKKEQPEYINVGLFYYPILMAADILIYKAELVPVGIDQEPHLELAREVARKFNRMFSTSTRLRRASKPIFPEPKRFATPGENVPSLTGEGKMSKSVPGSYIELTDDLKTIKAKLAKTPTDVGKGKSLPAGGGVAALLTLVELFQGKEKRKAYENQYLSKGIRYAQLKAELAEAIYKELKPIQKRRAYYQARPKLVARILEEGRQYCSRIARETLEEAKEAMGLA